MDNINILIIVTFIFSLFSTVSNSIGLEAYNNYDIDKKKPSNYGFLIFSLVISLLIFVGLLGYFGFIGYNFYKMNMKSA